MLGALSFDAGAGTAKEWGAQRRAAAARAAGSVESFMVIVLSMDAVTVSFRNLQ
ncbi:hypothetical protein HMPREF9166_1350 [Selenomonas sp. oral taxon 149 str. 67H29BP]|nr:hypothetical protein HMPREF9166_1350 [Selenomonas sp. oral taxon 149 str. 67H29BP]